MRHHLLATAFLSLSLAACAADDDVGTGEEAVTVDECAPDVLNRPQFEHIILGGANAFEPTSPADPRNADPFVLNVDATSAGGLMAHATVVSDEEVGGVCGCDSGSCVVDWISQNLGCDVCVDVLCDGGFVGGCVPCLDNIDEPNAAEGCVLPGSDSGTLSQ